MREAQRWSGSLVPVLALGLGLAMAAGDAPRTPGRRLIVYSVSPSAGSAAGGYSVAIMGSGFGPGMKVKIGDVDSSEVKVVDGTLMEFRVMPGSPGPTTVTVTDAQGRTANGKFIYTDPGPIPGELKITAPAEGAVIAAGSTITVSARATGGFRIASMLVVGTGFATTKNQDPSDSFSTTVSIPADAHGPFQIMLVAKDPKLNMKSADPVTITVLGPR